MKLTNGLAAIVAAGLTLPASPALAHCDTLDGPVVSNARAALMSQDVAPVLKWVRPEAETEIREAFRQTLSVRALGPEARALADRFFFETLVRVHRAGEGAAYTGLRAEGAEIDPAVAAADQALATGAVEVLTTQLGARIDAGLRLRFALAAEARRHAAESVEHGRKYVAAYVDFVHYAERLSQSALGEAPHAEPAPHAH
jgi:hypothetical protein